jgi:hypothetical protein
MVYLECLKLLSVSVTPPMPLIYKATPNEGFHFVLFAVDSPPTFVSLLFLRVKLNRLIYPYTVFS